MPDLDRELVEKSIKMVRERFGRSGHSRYMGWYAEDVREDHSRLRLRLREDFLGEQRTLHPGAVASFVDAAAGVAVAAGRTDMGPAWNATINLLVNFLAAPTTDELIATAEVRKRGKSVATVAVNVEDSAGELIATGTATFKMGVTFGVKAKK